MGTVLCMHRERERGGEKKKKREIFLEIGGFLCSSYGGMIGDQRGPSIAIFFLVASSVAEPSLKKGEERR